MKFVELSQGRDFLGACGSETKADEHLHVPPLPKTRMTRNRLSPFALRANKCAWISRPVAFTKICCV